MMIDKELDMDYTGYEIEAVPANEKSRNFYLYKAQGYMKTGYSDLYKRYIRLLETSNKYRDLARAAK
jgi:hypothetical protein